MNRETTHTDEEENQAVEEFRHFFSKFAKKISDMPEFKEQEEKLKKYGIRVIQFDVQIHQDARAKIIH